jgi:cell cycle arrest protein BUB2
MFLFVMPEPDAFFSFCAFIENCCPRYASQQIKGVYEGVEVFDKVLEHVDKDLHTKVIGVAKNPAVYAQLR